MQKGRKLTSASAIQVAQLSVMTFLQSIIYLRMRYTCTYGRTHKCCIVLCMFCSFSPVQLQHHWYIDTHKSLTCAQCTTVAHRVLCTLPFSSPVEHAIYVLYTYLISTNHNATTNKMKSATAHANNTKREIIIVKQNPWVSENCVPCTLSTRNSFVNITKFTKLYLLKFPPMRYLCLNPIEQ